VSVVTIVTLFLKPVIQICPIRIHCHDQAQSLWLATAFDLFLAKFRGGNVLHSLVIYQPDQVVPADVNAAIPGAVRGYALLEITGIPGVELASLLIGHDVNAELGIGHGWLNFRGS